MINYGGVLGKNEECGIVGIALARGNVALPLFYALYALQHRGQESAGIAVSGHTGVDKEEENETRECTGEITLVKGMGFVYEVLNNHRLESQKGNIGIGHVRYSTTGASKVENAEPLLVNYQRGKIAIAHNGNLVNTGELRRELEREGRVFHSTTDTEVCLLYTSDAADE